jgi:hypothetical protein
MNVIAFDIGFRNLAFAVITSENKLHFRLIDLESRLKRKEKKTIGRCRVLREIVEEALSFIEPEGPLSHPLAAPPLASLAKCKIVIEKQVQTNVIAMGLMYALVSISQQFAKEIVLFSPNQKFILLKQDYSVVDKAHKKLSVKLTRDIIREKYPESLHEFEALRKQDDVADAFLMAYLSRRTRPSTKRIPQCKVE